MTKTDMKNIIIILCCVLVVVSLGAIVSQTFDFIDSQNEQRTVDFSQLTYVALGDSITQGCDIYGTYKVDYPLFVRQELGLASYKNYGLHSTTIAVRSGFTTSFLERYKTMQSADIVSVLGGVNDYQTNVPLGTIDDTSLTTFYGAVNALAKGLKEKYPNSFVFFMTPYPCSSHWTDKNTSRYTLEDYANAIKQVCAKYDIPVLDLYNYGDFDYDKNSRDGLHPDEKFFVTNTAPQIAQFIRDNYNK